jgi:hypothetical protein
MTTMNDDAEEHFLAGLDFFSGARPSSASELSQHDQPD